MVLFSFLFARFLGIFGAFFDDFWAIFWRFFEEFSGQKIQEKIRKNSRKNEKKIKKNVEKICPFLKVFEKFDDSKKITKIKFTISTNCACLCSNLSRKKMNFVIDREKYAACCGQNKMKMTWIQVKLRFNALEIKVVVACCINHLLAVVIVVLQLNRGLFQLHYISFARSYDLKCLAL